MQPQPCRCRAKDRADMKMNRRFIAAILRAAKVEAATPLPWTTAAVVRARRAARLKTG